MILWESDIQESVVFKPAEIRGKRGRKKMKKANGAIYIPNMNEDSFQKICNEKGLQFVYVPVPPHGRLIDADGEVGVNVTMMPGGKCRVDLIAPTIIPANEGEA